MIASFRRLFVPGLLIGASLVTVAEAQSPSIGSLSPQAVKPGQSFDVTIHGGNLAEATQLWTSFPCEAVLSPDVPDNGKKSDQVVYRITVPAEVTPGIHGLRVVTNKGISGLKLIAVDDLPTVARQGNNVSPSAAQPISLPVAVDGTMGALERHYYRFQAGDGQKLSFEVLARRLGSPLDPMIRVLDAAGRELAYSDDEPGLMADSQLSYTFPQAGEYLLEVRDIRYQGGGNFFYRLRVGDFPCVTVPYPMGAKPGSTVNLTFAGSDLEGVPPAALQIPGDTSAEWLPVAAKRAGGQSSGFAVLKVSRGEEFLETEPNDAPDKANRVPLGTHLNGRLDRPGDVDRFTVTAKKGDAYQFAAITRRQGSPADLLLRLYDASGKKVAEAEDSGPYDGAFTYTFPADGDYTLLVEDLSNRGGSRFVYRIEVTPPQTGFALSATADGLNIPAGGVTAVTVNASRQGYNGPIAIAAVDLPNGVTSIPTIIGPGQNSVVFTVRSTAEAPTGKLFPIRIVGSAKIGDADFQADATITGALTSSFNGIPFPPQVLSRAIALGIAPRPPFALRTEPAQIVFGRNLKATVKVVAERQDGYDEPIELAVTPAKNGLPNGVTAALKPIPKGQNEVEATFSANEKAPLGEFTATLVGTHKKDKATVTETVPGIGLKLDQPFQLSADVGDGKLKRGGNIKIKVTVKRNPALAGAVALTFDNLPKGVTASEATIAAEGTEVEILLSAAQDAQVATVNNVTVKGAVTVEKTTFSEATPAVTLTVE